MYTQKKAIIFIKLTLYYKTESQYDNTILYYIQHYGYLQKERIK